MPVSDGPRGPRGRLGSWTVWAALTEASRTRSGVWPRVSSHGGGWRCGKREQAGRALALSGQAAGRAALAVAASARERCAKK